MKMVIRIYSIYDKKAGCFNKPFTHHNDAIATREFQIASSDPKIAQLSIFPDDFDLYYLGDFDDQTGTLLQKEKPQFIVAATTFKDEMQERMRKTVTLETEK